MSTRDVAERWGVFGRPTSLAFVETFSNRQCHYHRLLKLLYRPRWQSSVTVKLPMVQLLPCRLLLLHIVRHLPAIPRH